MYQEPAAAPTVAATAEVGRGAGLQTEKLHFASQKPTNTLDTITAELLLLFMDIATKRINNSLSCTYLSSLSLSSLLWYWYRLLSAAESMGNW